MASSSMRYTNLVPVGLKEAALDSPSFRAASLHLNDQADLLERWLDGLIKASSKLSQEAAILDNMVNSLTASLSPPANLSEALIDHDYSLLAARSFSELIKDCWAAKVAELRKVETLITDPLRAFQQNELRSFKEDRKQLEQTQKIVDQLQMRYSGQSKTKEPSSLREDAFQLHEARKAYLKASMDFASSAPRLRLTLDQVLVRAFYDQSRATYREGNNVLHARLQHQLGRIWSWSKEIELNDRSWRKEHSDARKQIEEAAEQGARPSRELEDYAQSATASLNNRGPSTSTILKPKMTGGKQGWLNAKSMTGKPARPAWVRRWFYVKNGVFGWLVQGSRSGGVEESERIGVLLCGLRFATSEERRFCFEVKTKDNTLVLQADSQFELAEWMAAFDGVKQRALEDPTNQRTSHPGVQAKQMLGLAFAITPPSAVEFAANSIEANLSSEDSHDRTTSLSLAPPNDTSSLTHRGSFDVSPGRRSTAFEGDTSRDQAGKVRQRFDIRKPPNGSSSGQTGNVTAGGIASLISASHMTLPLAPSAVAPMPSLESSVRSSSIGIRTNLSIALKAIPSSTLAPNTLVNPPNPTNLSSTAVMLSSEKGIVIDRANNTESTPSGPLANTWGSFDWISVDESGGNLDTSDAVQSGEELDTNKNLPEIDSKNSIEHSGASSYPAHRKTVSLDGDAVDLERAKTSVSDFPRQYPKLLRHQYAQFRLLFPQANEEEKPLLVFQAVWSFDNQQQISGRIFVTMNDCYFYSSQSGMIQATSVKFKDILDITAAPGREFDVIFLHLRQFEGIEQSRITIKIFLESLGLLQRRLDFLLLNARSRSPQDLTTCIQKLAELEISNDEEARDPTRDSREITKNTPLRKGFESEPQAAGSSRYPRFEFESLRVGHKEIENTNLDLKVSNMVTSYDGIEKAPISQRDFEISTKALFYILCGDRSVVSQLLYHERGAKNIQRGPWQRIEQDQYRRSFEYTIEEINPVGRIRRPRLVDTQTIDVVSDHLCVLTYRRRPWSIPYSNSFVLIIRLVISQTGRSRCKLVIYTSIDWIKQMPLLAQVIERRGLADLEQDALDLIAATSQQAYRLGTHSSTKKAIRIFGTLEQATQTIEFEGGKHLVLSLRPYRGGRRTLPGLLINHVVSTATSLLFLVIAYIRKVARCDYTLLNTHFLISMLLFLSVILNMLLSSSELINFWHERRASQFMRDLGIGRGLVIDKSVSLSTVDSAIHLDEDLLLNADNLCYATFLSGATPGSSTPTYSTSNPSMRRLRQSRQNMGSYRHDLLVALKVVNSIDREIRQAEWEYWITEETESCRRAEQWLLASKKSTSHSSSSKESSNVGDAEKLRNYCWSCAAAKHELALS